MDLEVDWLKVLKEKRLIILNFHSRNKIYIIYVLFSLVDQLTENLNKVLKLTTKYNVI